MTIAAVMLEAAPFLFGFLCYVAGIMTALPFHRPARSDLFDSGEG